MKKIFKWLLRFLFVIVPTIFLGFLFIYYSIDNLSRFNHFYRIDDVLPYWAVCICFWLPFTLIGIVIILRWFNVTEKALRIIMRISGVLMFSFTITKIFEFTNHSDLSSIHPASYIIEGLLTLLIAIFCFLPDKFFKIKWILLILSILVICVPNTHQIVNYLYMTSASIPMIRYIINEIVTNIFPYVSILLCAQLMREKKI